jgi:hypothetical protein
MRFLSVWVFKFRDVVRHAAYILVESELEVRTAVGGVSRDRNLLTQHRAAEYRPRGND